MGPLDAFRACALLMALTPAASRPQDAADADARGRELARVITEAVKEEDGPALRTALQELDPLYDQIPAKTLAKVHKALALMFRDFEPRVEWERPVVSTGPTDDEMIITKDTRDEVLQCYRMAVGVLYHRPDGAELLQGALKAPHVKEWPQVVAVIVEGLGYRVDPDLLTVFVARLDDPSPAVASAAANALAQFHEQPQDLRRRAVAPLIEEWLAAEKAATKEAGRIKEDDPAPAADRLALIEVAFGEALAVLTRQRCEGPSAWKAWFDEQGRESGW